MCPTNGFENKFAFKFLRFLFFFVVVVFFTLFLTLILCTKKTFYPKSKTTFSIQFFLNNFCFFYASSKMSKNMNKLRVKLRNATIYHP